MDDTEYTGGRERDPLGYAHDLEEALNDAAISAFEDPSPVGTFSQESRRAAVRLAIALGRCRLFDIKVDRFDGTLPWPVARAAAEELRPLLEQWCEEACALPERFDDADIGEAEDLCADLLERRMLVWAAYVAIEESEESSADSVKRDQVHLAIAVDRLLTTMNRLDDVLTEDEHLNLLSVVSATNILENWRMMLAPTFRELLPWWLDGTLESIAEQIQQSLVAVSPVPQSLLAIDSAPRRSWFEVVSLAAALAEVDQSVFLTWISPDGAARAMLLRRVLQTIDSEVPIEFFDSTARPWRDKIGKIVQLGRLTSTIDETSRAWFRCGDLQQLAVASPAPPDLLVGDERSAWRPVE